MFSADLRTRGEVMDDHSPWRSLTVVGGRSALKLVAVPLLSSPKKGEKRGYNLRRDLVPLAGLKITKNGTGRYVVVGDGPYKVENRGKKEKKKDLCVKVTQIWLKETSKRGRSQRGKR